MLLRAFNGTGFLEAVTGLDKLHAEGKETLEAVDWARMRTIERVREEISEGWGDDDVYLNKCTAQERQARQPAPLRGICHI
jgi:hypothetical protein